jgi:hypothetical protein
LELRRNVLVEGVPHPVPQQHPAQPSLAGAEDRYLELTRDVIQTKKKKLRNELSDPAVSQGLNNF